jgi:hypothetical protein
MRAGRQLLRAREGPPEPVGESADGLQGVQPVLGPHHLRRADAVEPVVPRDPLRLAVLLNRPGDHHSLVRAGEHGNARRPLKVRLAPLLQPHLAQHDRRARVVADVKNRLPVVELVGHLRAGLEAVCEPAIEHLELAVESDLPREHEPDAFEHHLQRDVARARPLGLRATFLSGRHF